MAPHAEFGVYPVLNFQTLVHFSTFQHVLLKLFSSSLDRVDTLSSRQKLFFANCSRKLIKPAEREEEFEKIRAEYKKVVEDSNEKVQIAEDCYTLVDRYLRKLDDELLKFKCELEADNRGITEILEKQSLELDAPPRSSMTNGHRHTKKHKKITHSQKNNDTLSSLLAQSPSTSFKVLFSFQIINPIK